MKCHTKSFYLFRGSWFDIFDKLIGIIKPNNTEQFSVWESRKKDNGHLLIVYGVQLTDDWQKRCDVTSITEAEFQSNYRSQIRQHIIHGYNEFKSTSGIFPFLSKW